MAFDWLKRKALPAGSSSVVILNEASSSIPSNVRAYVKEGYGENPIVYACVNKIAEAFASVKLELHTVTKTGDRKVDVAGKVLDLLAKPNPTQTWEDFAHELVAWHRVAGEAFILRLPATGEPSELHLLNPSDMVVKPGAGGVPSAYIYGSGENKKEYKVNLVKGTSQVLHIKTPNLADPWRGLSPLSPSARATDIHNNGARWNSSLLANGARPSGVVEIGSEVGEDTLSRLKEYFQKAWGGTANVGKLPILTGGAKYTPLSHTPKDMDFGTMMGASAKDIALAYGVPLPLVTMEASTFANMDAAQERLWMETVLPLLNVIIKKLSAFLMPLHGEDKSKVLAFNADSVPALEPRRERLYKRMGTAVRDGLITVDEARAEMGFEELGGNAAIISANRPVEPTEKPKELVKALKECGYSASEIVEAVGPEFNLKKAA